MATLLNGSRAVTVKLNGEPTVEVGGAERDSLVAVAGLTPIAFEVPVIDEAAASVAVMVRVPAVLSVAETTPMPPTSVESTGSAAAPSVLVKWTVPV